MSKRPQVTRVYQNHHLDSTRWQHYVPRDDDIIISTAYKSGTTWTQNIIRYLILPDAELSKISHFSPWVGATWHTIEEIMERIETQTHRRCIKSHLALDGLPYFPQVKYIIVGRDPRDVFMSLWNHYHNYTDDFYAEMNDNPDLVGDPMPRCPHDIHDFWEQWMTRGWFEWESEGYPFWGNMHHTQSYWDYKHLPNILFVHYNNLLNDTHTEIRRMADYFEMDVTDDHIDKIVELTSFDHMKKHSETLLGKSQDFKGGSKAFINKGTNGRWKEVLSEAELDLYDKAAQRVLSPDCRHWLEIGNFFKQQST